jgi:hypothetical protein
MDTYGHLFDEIQRETAAKMDAILRADESLVVVKTVVRPSDHRPN